MWERANGGEDLNVQVFQTFLESIAISLPTPLCKIVFNAIDRDGSGEIDYDEFETFVYDKNEPFQVTQTLYSGVM